MANVDFKSKFLESDRTRTKSQVDTLCWELPLEDYVDEELFPIFCQTKAFDTVDEGQAIVDVLKKEGGILKKDVKVARDDGQIWPVYPTTIFDDRGDNEVGVLWVKKGFLNREELDPTAAIAGSANGRPKWPSSAGTFVMKRARLLRLVRELLGPKFERMVDVWLAWTRKQEP